MLNGLFPQLMVVPGTWRLMAKRSVSPARTMLLLRWRDVRSFCRLRTPARYMAESPLRLRRAGAPITSELPGAGCRRINYRQSVKKGFYRWLKAESFPEPPAWLEVFCAQKNADARGIGISSAKYACYTSRASIRSAFGTSKTMFSSRPSSGTASPPPSACRRAMTFCTRMSGAEAPAVTPTHFASFTHPV
jgi:hypothetical protein